ncbi:MAG: hypothetical protein ACI8WT_002971 [Clostridium sp.]|jgi:hypothetical protein
MNSEEKDIFEIFNNLSEDESLRLLDGIEMESIEMNEVQKKRMESSVIKKIKVSQSKHKTVKRLVVAGIAFIIILSAFIPFNQKSLAEIIKQLYFAPGIGTVIDNKANGIFVLTNPITFEYSNSKVTVKGAIKDKDTVTIRIEGDNASSLSAIGKLIIIDEKNEKYSCSGTTGFGSGWMGEYTFSNVSKDSMNFKILLPDKREIPLSMSKAENITDFIKIGPTYLKNGLQITLAPFKYDNKIAFNLIVNPMKDKQVESYQREDEQGTHTMMSVKDEKGKSYLIDYDKINFNPLSEFYFKPEDGLKKYTINISEVKLKYNVKLNNDVTIPLPSTGEKLINQKVNINGYNLNITKVSRYGKSVIVYIDTNYDINKMENLSEVRLDIDSELNGWHTNSNNVIEYYMGEEVNPKDTTITLKFREMYTILKGPWEFEFTSDNNNFKW